MRTLPNKPDAVERKALDDPAHREAVRCFVLKMVKEPLLAEDLTHDVFVRAVPSLATYRRDATIKSWLCAIALNVVRDHFRKPQHRVITTSDEETIAGLSANTDIERNAINGELVDCIQHYVLRLPEQFRDVVALHDIAELTHREVAAVLDISEAHSRVLLHRGRAALKASLEQNCVLSFDDDNFPCEPKPTAPQG